jgi:hypothetical protein
VLLLQLLPLPLERRQAVTVALAVLAVMAA